MPDEGCSTLPDVFHYLDIDRRHLPAEEYELLIAEGQKIASSAGNYGGDRQMVTVAIHPTGLWMHVPGVALEPDLDADDERRQRMPGVQAVIERAREKGCRWVNLDSDAEVDPELPYYER